MSLNVKTKPVAAFEVAHDSPEARKPGAFHFVVAPPGLKGSVPGERMAIVHACPCGCGGQTMLWFRGKETKGSDAWDVAGEWPKVTLAPSIGVKYDGAGNGPMKFHWHGFLERGWFVNERHEAPRG